jgi:UDP-N-acetylmuramoyl-tripeptide--D-alanyl-D-alanine ligase
MRLTLGDISTRMRGRILSGSPDLVPRGASIDSRTLLSGELFFAIRGSVHDGHLFSAAAVGAGACGVVVDAKGVASAAGGRGAVVVVDDTTRALQDLAASVRAESRVAVAAITGSVGKTTTKDLARLLLSGERRVHASPGNLNNHYGLPLALLRLPADAEACVLELGISTPGEMDRLVEMAAPDVGLVTRVSSVHLGNFPSFDALCDEKMKLPRGSRRALLNSDDEAQVARAAGIAAVSWFGEGDAATGLRLVAVESQGLAGSHVTLDECGERHAVQLPLAGRHQARNLLAAAAIARALGVSWESLVAQAAQARPTRHRGEVLDVSGTTVVDDTYNANPLAMRAALELLGERRSRGRRIFVAGDMLELGEIAEKEHESLGRDAAARAEIVVAVGPLGALVARAARAGGAEAIALENAAAAGEWLVANVREHDVVLLKGSRGIGLDRALDILVESRGPVSNGAGGRS